MEGLALRCKLESQGVNLPKGFHAKNDSHATRDEVFDLIRRQQPRIDLTFLAKNKAYPSIRERGQMYLYKLAWYLHFQRDHLAGLRAWGQALRDRCDAQDSQEGGQCTGCAEGGVRSSSPRPGRRLVRVGRAQLVGCPGRRLRPVGCAASAREQAVPVVRPVHQAHGGDKVPALGAGIDVAGLSRFPETRSPGPLVTRPGTRIAYACSTVKRRRACRGAIRDQDRAERNPAVTRD
jgi:hypothetical protein